MFRHRLPHAAAGLDLDPSSFPRTENRCGRSRRPSGAVPISSPFPSLPPHLPSLHELVEQASCPALFRRKRAASCSRGAYRLVIDRPGLLPQPAAWSWPKASGTFPRPPRLWAPRRGLGSVGNKQEKRATEKRKQECVRDGSGAAVEGLPFSDPVR